MNISPDALPARTPRRLGVAALVAVAVGGCDGATAGPCEHEYREPLFVLAAVTDARTGTALPRVALRDVSIGGRAAPASALAAGPARGVATVADSLLCDVACGFGLGEGAYRFTVSAMGYAPLVVEREASYPVFHGGCPSYNAGSVELRLQLSPTP